MAMRQMPNIKHCPINVYVVKNKSKNSKSILFHFSSFHHHSHIFLLLYQ